jgi:ABC-2 type transport system ATP-binding protein
VTKVLGTAYEIRGLTKRYPRQPQPANEAIDLTIGEGEVFGLLGDNGAGKSTLVRQMVGLLKPDAGSVRLLGRAVPDHPAFVSLQVGYMPQSAFALNHLKVGEAIYFSAHLRGAARRAAREHRDQLIDQLGLGPVAGRVSRQLSGGQRRLLQLAVAMAGRPPLLLLDEPTNDLDPQRRRLVWQVLREVNRQQGSTVIFVTHDAIEAEKAIQRVGIMRRGRLVAVGRPADLKREVDHKLRLELVYPPAVVPKLPGDLPWRQVDTGRWLAYLEVREVNQVLTDVDLDALEDVRLHSATLEDLYLHYADDVRSR